MSRRFVAGNNGLPRPGHCLTRTIKEMFTRYKTMTGRYWAPRPRYPYTKPPN